MSKWTSTLATENLTERQSRNNNGINTVILPNNCLLAAFNVVLHCYVHILCVLVSSASLIVTKSRQKQHCGLAVALMFCIKKKVAQKVPTQNKQLLGSWLEGAEWLIDPWVQGRLINNQCLQMFRPSWNLEHLPVNTRKRCFFSIWLSDFQFSYIMIVLASTSTKPLP